MKAVGRDSESKESVEGVNKRVDQCRGRRLDLEAVAVDTGCEAFLAFSVVVAVVLTIVIVVVVVVVSLRNR